MQKTKDQQRNYLPRQEGYTISLLKMCYCLLSQPNERKEFKNVLLTLPEHWIYKKKDLEVVNFVRKYHAQYQVFPTYGEVASGVTAPLRTAFAKDEINLDNPSAYIDGFKISYRDYYIDEQVLKFSEQKHNADFNVKDYILEVSKTVSEIQTDQTKGDVYEVTQQITERLQQHLKISENDGVTFLPTGYPIFDEITQGYEKGRYWLIGGVEGLGKTWLLLYLAHALNMLLIDKDGDERAKAILPKRPVLFISGEVPREELLQRLDCIGAGISYSKFIKGYTRKSRLANDLLGELHGEEDKNFFNQLPESSYAQKMSDVPEQVRLMNYYPKLLEWVYKSENLYDKNRTEQDRVSSSNFMIVDDCVSLSGIEAYIDKFDPSVVFVDGIQLFAKGRDWKDMLDIAIELKKLAKKKKCHIVATSHLKTKVTDIQDVNEDVFAYFKGSRDADDTFVLFQSHDQVISNELTLCPAKGRREGAGVDRAVVLCLNKEDCSMEMVRYADTEKNKVNALLSDNEKHKQAIKSAMFNNKI